MTLNLIANKIFKEKTTPLRLQDYCKNHNVNINVYDINDFPDHCFYPIGLSFFDFSIDYFRLIPYNVACALKEGTLKILFYYHEGDNPYQIKQRLDLLFRNRAPGNCYVFISGNTMAKNIDRFVYFNDFELWYRQCNQTVLPTYIHSNLREKDFTVLSRLHKSWRATVMTDLKRQGLLCNSYWSYCESGAYLDNDNPIEIHTFENLYNDTRSFLEGAPYFSDNLDNTQRNNHSMHQSKYFDNAYCNIVLETYFDIKECQGTFLTEKTFKPIKHGQLFFIAGPPGSLGLLRSLGYRVFDNVLDNSYDDILDPTMRWKKLCKSIAEAKNNLPELFKFAKEDIEHNQKLFMHKKNNRLEKLIKQINEFS